MRALELLRLEARAGEDGGEAARAATGEAGAEATGKAAGEAGGEAGGEAARAAAASTLSSNAAATLLKLKRPKEALAACPDLSPVNKVLNPNLIRP